MCGEVREGYVWGNGIAFASVTYTLCLLSDKYLHNKRRDWARGNRNRNKDFTTTAQVH